MNSPVNKNTRTSRDAQSRTNNARRAPWKPPSMLDAPKPPEGYVHRWIRTEVMGFDDRRNVSAKGREGWELVRKDEYPDFEVPSIEDGKHAGVIGVGGLLLARIPVETVEERSKYFRDQARNQMTAVDNDLAREEHPAMPIHKAERQSRVSFGGSRKSED